MDESLREVLLADDRIAYALLLNTQQDDRIGEWREARYAGDFPLDRSTAGQG
ncbi:MAG TPA: hypothetical protein VJZ76_14485 [Thermoanaerobaculia bacterium]|nr:hypothetical protein [Thermoanaerobaculia bacterium]